MNNKKALDLDLKLFEAPAISFAKHLDLPDNSRIIFSGMYGAGKSTFINHFFSDEVQLQYFNIKRYNVIHLYPVNYTISTNEDIFKYIKIDILNYILKEYPNVVDETTFSFSTIASYLIANKLGHLVPSLFLLLGQIGETDLLSDMGIPEEVSKPASVFQSLHNMLNVLAGKYDELKNGPNELKKIESFLSEDTHKEGSPYELNFITSLIIDFIKRLKEEVTEARVELDDTDTNKKTKIETVLVIDDLDRLDPSHVFRLFNIFAAHLNDKDELQNKFGFSKVIFVCDIANIRRLYAHFYGSNTSFSGYIDKFYSNKVFYYNNIDVVRQMASTFVQQSNFFYDVYNNGNKKPIKNDLVFYNLSNILSTFLINSSISLRSLLKLRNPFQITYKDVNLSLPYTYTISISAIVELEVLISLLGSKEDVMDAFLLAKLNSNLAEKNLEDRAYYNFAMSCLPVIGTAYENTRSLYSREEVFITLKLDNREYNRGDISVTGRDRKNPYPNSTTLDIDAADMYIKALNYLSVKKIL